MRVPVFDRLFKILVDNGLNIVTKLLALLMAGYAIVNITYATDADGTIYRILGNTIPILCSILIILDTHRSPFFTVGLFAISIGVSRIVAYAPMMITDNLFQFYERFFLTILACNLTYSGYRYLIGRSKSIFTIILSALVFTIVIPLELFLKYYIRRDLGSIVEDNLDQLLLVGLYAMYISIIWSDKVRESTDVARSELIITGFRMAMARSPDLAIDASSANEVIRFTMGDRKFDLENEPSGSPVFARYEFDVTDRGDGYGTLERWGGRDGPMFLYFSDHKGGSAVNRHPFKVTRVHSRGGYLMINYKDDGLLALRIKFPDETDGPIHYKITEEELIDEDEN